MFAGVGDASGLDDVFVCTWAGLAFVGWWVAGLLLLGDLVGFMVSVLVYCAV